MVRLRIVFDRPGRVSRAAALATLAAATCLTACSGRLDSSRVAIADDGRVFVWSSRQPVRIFDRRLNLLSVAAVPSPGPAGAVVAIDGRGSAYVEDDDVSAGRALRVYRLSGDRRYADEPVILGRPQDRDPGVVQIAADGGGHVYYSSLHGAGISVAVHDRAGRFRPDGELRGARTGISDDVYFAVTPAGEVCVEDFATTVGIACFAPGARGNSAPRYRSDEVHKAGALAVRSDGREVAVADDRDREIDLYRMSGSRIVPAGRIAGSRTRLALPLGISYDRADGLVVADEHAVLFFGDRDRGNVAPERVIAGPRTRISDGNNAIVAADGTTFVSNTVTRVGKAPDLLIFAPGSRGNASPRHVACNDPLTPAGEAIALDREFIYSSAGRGLQATRLNGRGTVIVDSASVIADASQIAFDERGHPVFAGSNEIVVLPRTSATGDPKPLRVVAAGPFANDPPCCIVADERYAFLIDTSHDRILRYDLRHPARVASLGGADTTLNKPVALALDRHGGLLVANGFDGRILTFGEEAVGNARPLRELRVPRSGDENTMDLAVATDGTLYVVEGPAAYIGVRPPSGAVLQFAPGAAENVPPARVAGVPLTNFVDEP